MMKQILLATSIVALTAGGAFAQGTTPGGTTPSTHGLIAPQTPTPGMPSPGTGSNSATGAMNGASAAATASRSPSMVKQAQTVLKDKGLYQGRVDGKIGPATKAAIAKFQKRTGLRQTAKLDSRTMNELLGGGSTSSGESRGAMSGAIGGGPMH